jgi:hypothetical protein
MLIVVPVTSRKRITPGDTRRNSEQDDEGIDKGRKLRHEDEEDEHDRHDEAYRKGLERLVHVVDGASHGQDRSVRRMRARDDFVRTSLLIVERFSAFGIT